MRYFTRWRVLSWDSCHLWVPFMLSISNHLEKRYQKRNWDLIQCFSALTINLIYWNAILTRTLLINVANVDNHSKSYITASLPCPHCTLLVQAANKSRQTLTCTLSTFLWLLLWAWNQLTRSACVIDLRASIWNTQEGGFSSTVVVQVILYMEVFSLQPLLHWIKEPFENM